MRHLFLTSLFALALFISAVAVVPTAHAQNTVTIDQGTAAQAQQICLANGNSVEECQAVFDAYIAAAGTTVPVDKAAANTPTTFTAPPQDTGKSLNGVMAWIASLFAWLAGIAMIALNYAVFFTVITMGSYVKDLAAVGVTWSILRDLGNILLIFGFLAIGISIILNTERLGYGKKMLPMLLVAAVFLNFSLFITEAVIDTGNLFATQFYKQINGGTLPTLETAGNQGVSDTIMNRLGLTTIYGKAADPQVKALYETNPMFIGFMSIILFIILAFVLFSLAFILIARFVILLFLIILSPIGFAGLAVPKLKSTADKWWSTLFEQTITAPVLMLLLYIALTVITDNNFLKISGGTPNWLGVFQGDAAGIGGFASALLSFLVAMGLLLAVVIVSKKLSAFGASGATKLAGKLTFGATAWAGRNSGGWLAAKAARGLKRTAFSRVPLVGTGLVKGLDRIGTANFDVRSAMTGAGLKVEAGAVQKGGYKADLKARTESRTKYASELKGRELTPEEKLKQQVAKDDIKDLDKGAKAAGAHWVLAENKRVAALAELEKERNVLSKEEFKVKEESINASMTGVNDDLKKAKEALEKRQKELEDIESVTDAGAKREYARALNLYSDEKNMFNRIFNFSANTDAAKKIRDEAKKSPDDKTLDSLKKALKKASGEEETPTPTPAPAPATPPPAPTVTPTTTP